MCISPNLSIDKRYLPHKIAPKRPPDPSLCKLESLSRVGPVADGAASSNAVEASSHVARAQPLAEQHLVLCRRHYHDQDAPHRLSPLILQPARHTGPQRHRAVNRRLPDPSIYITHFLVACQDAVRTGKPPAAGRAGHELCPDSVHGFHGMTLAPRRRVQKVGKRRN